MYGLLFFFFITIRLSAMSIPKEKNFPNTKAMLQKRAGHFPVEE